MENKKQESAVEWLVKYLTLHRIELNNNAIQNVINVAKDMEKEQIMDAYRINPNNQKWSNSGIDYYNETFKSE
jgi:hypothetical protein